jgi:hypothetical protein
MTTDMNKVLIIIFIIHLEGEVVIDAMIILSYAV